MIVIFVAHGGKEGIFQAKINLDAWSKGETVKVQFVM